MPELLRRYPSLYHVRRNFPVPVAPLLRVARQSQWLIISPALLPPSYFRTYLPPCSCKLSP